MTDRLLADMSSRIPSSTARVNTDVASDERDDGEQDAAKKESMPFTPVTLFGANVQIPSSVSMPVEAYPNATVTLVSARQQDDVRSTTIIFQTTDAKATALAWYDDAFARVKWTRVSHADTDISGARVYSHAREEVAIHAVSSIRAEKKTVITIVYRAPAL